MKKALILAMAIMAVGCASTDKYMMVYKSELVSAQSSGTGALVGGAVGLATGGGHSTGSKVIRTVGGAALGGAVERSLTSGNMRVRAIVFDETGTIKTVYYNQLLRPGDCIQYKNKNMVASVNKVDPSFCVANYQ